MPLRIKNLITKIRIAFLWVLVPIQKAFQRSGRRETVITQLIVDQIVKLVRPGDILLSYEAQRFTSLFIKGFYDHAVIVSSRCTVIEAVGDKRGYREDGTFGNIGGVREVPLVEWLFKKDHVAVIRVIASQGIIDQAAKSSLTYIGRSYDYYFSFDNDKIYCSELPYMCYRSAWPEFLKEHPAGKEILPQYYLKLAESLPYLKTIYNTHPEPK